MSSRSWPQRHSGRSWKEEVGSEGLGLGSGLSAVGGGGGTVFWTLLELNSQA